MSAQEFHKPDVIYRDDLTGLYNRKYYRESFSEMARVLQEQGFPLSLLIIDIDHFKSVNDNYGHHTGDAVITAVAALISTTAIEHSGIPIRYAGDEFIVLFPRSNRDKAFSSAEAIRRAVAERPVALGAGGKTLAMTVSIGLAQFPRDMEDPGGLFDLADECVYLSKRKGRNAVSTPDDRTAVTIEKDSLSRFAPCRTFVGRRELLERLRPFASSSPLPSRPVVVLEGDLGVGKTRLLREVSAGTDDQRCLTFFVRSFPHLMSQPFVELVDVLSTLLAPYPERCEKCAGRLGREELLAATRFLPWLAPYLTPDAAASGGGPPGRETLVRAFAEICFGIAEDRPIVGFFSDFQFSGRATRLVLEKMKADPRGSNAAFYLDFDDVEGGETLRKELDAFLESFARAGLLHKERVETLTDSEIDEMARGILPGIDRYGEALTILRQKAKGNPKVLEEAIKFLITGDVISLRDGKLQVAPFSADLLPEGFEALRRPLVESLDPDVRALLSKAAVIGDSFDLSVVKELEEMNEGHVVDILERAEKASLIVAEEGGERYRFLDRLTGENFYHSLGDDERGELHMKVAAALEKINVGKLDGVLASLLRHFERSGQSEKAEHYRAEYARHFAGFEAPPTAELYVGRLPEAGESWGSERPLTAQEELHAIRAARLLRMTMRNLAVFPMESEIVKGTLSSAFRELSALLEEVGILSYSVGEGTLLVNGSAVDWENNKDAGEVELRALLGKADLNGISFRAGLTGQEFASFFELLAGAGSGAASPGGGWKEALRERGIVHAAADERIYVAISSRNIITPEAVRKEKIVVGGAAAAAPSQGESPSLLESVPEGLRAKLEELSGSLSGIEDIKTQFDIISDFLNSTLLVELARIKAAAPGAEHAPQAAAPPPVDMPKEAPPPQKVEDPELRAVEEARRRLNMEAIRRLREEPEVVVHDLESADDGVVDGAAAALTAKGKTSIPSLVRFLKTSDNLKAQKTASHVLFTVEPGARNILNDELAGGSSPEEKVRLLEVMSEVPGVDVTGHAALLVRASDREMRRAIFRLLESRSGEKVKAFLLDALMEKESDFLIELLQSIGRLRVQEAVPHLRRMVRKRTIFEVEPDVKLQEEACRALGQIGDKAALDVLVDNASSAFSPLRRTKDRRIRAAAVYALCHFPDDRVRKLLEIHARHRDPMIRSAASLALARLTGGDAGEPPAF